MTSSRAEQPRKSPDRPALAASVASGTRAERSPGEPDPAPLTVIVPFFNEAATLGQTVARLLSSVPADAQVVVVDDGSTDDGAAQLGRFGDTVERLKFAANRGKTAAVRAALAQARGKYIIVQDADSEYDPADIPMLLQQAETSAARTGVPVAVFGRRPSYWHDPRRWLFAGGVLAIDLLLAVCHRRFLRDHATCYKLLDRQTMVRLDLSSSGFEGCVEITSKLFRRGVPVAQVPISYRPRSIRQGKKLAPAYFLRAVSAVWRWRS